MKYKSIFVSDIHLGTKYSKTKEFLSFLKHNSCENMYLVGDIIDGWAIKRKLTWPQSHSDVVQKILKSSRKGTNIYLIAGNHDEFLRPFLPLVLGNSLHFVSEIDYTSIKGEKFLITHGDFFDSITMTKKWLAIVGDYGYEFLLFLNEKLQYFRRKLKLKRNWSLSKYVKDNVKKSVSFINDYENVLSKHAKHYKYDGVICGHIHKAEISTINDVKYLNCGDWVESCTAIVETFEGEFILINWLERQDD